MSDAVLQAVIEGHARQLRTPTIARECPAVARRARDEGWSYEEFLRELLEARDDRTLNEGQELPHRSWQTWRSGALCPRVRSKVRSKSHRWIPEVHDVGAETRQLGHSGYESSRRKSKKCARESEK